MKSYEGGVRTPMIASWPDGITVSDGSILRQVGDVMDFMPTFVDLANATYPKEFKGHKITPMEGRSLVPIFKGEHLEERKMLFNAHKGGRYMRKSNWKLVRLGPKDSWHLYNMSKDGSETHDLKDKYPRKVQLLDSLWQQWAHRVHVFPKP
jgi:arylsulfatase